MSLPLPERSARPFVLPGERASALLLHGFTGCPIEVRLVGDALSEAGIGCRAPLLPGHGGPDPMVLARTRHSAWIDAAWSAWRELDEGKPRFIVGSSMGGALAILLASTLREQLDGLVLLAPALVLQPTGQVGAVLARGGLGRAVATITKEDPGGDCADPDGRATNAGYPVMPVAAIAEFDRVRSLAVDALEGVRAPIATFHGLHDHTIDPVASALVAERTRAAWVERTVLPRSQHLLALDHDRAAVCRYTVAFVERCLRARRAA